MAKDPVSGITLDNKSPCKSTHAGQVHVFCCPSCKTSFDNERGRYVAPAGGEIQRGDRP
jgi:YHS domain-containing protein